MLYKKTLETSCRFDVVVISDFVKEAVAQSGVQEGICVVQIPHSTAGICSTTGYPDVRADLQEELERLVPSRIDFCHHESPYDAAGHIKTALFGSTLSLIISSGELVAGRSEDILLLEFDGPRTRNVIVRVMRDDG